VWLHVTDMCPKQKYTPNDGSLAEQYLRSNGNPISAKDLTWSYAAFLTANSARAQAMPASWGAASVCHSSRACALALTSLL